MKPLTANVRIRQRVAGAIAISCQPSLLIAREVTAGQSIIRSARTRIDGGSTMFSAWAVRRLT